MTPPRSPGSGGKGQIARCQNLKRKTLVLQGALAKACLLDPGQAEKKSPAGTAGEGVHPYWSRGEEVGGPASAFRTSGPISLL